MARTTWANDPYNVPKFPDGAVAITPNDSTDLKATYPGGVTCYVTATGNVVVTPAMDELSDITLTNVPAYTIIPFKVAKVKAATTATVVGLI